MKKILVLVTAILFSLSLAAAVSYEYSVDHIDIQITNNGDLQIDNGVYYTDLAFPARSVSVELIEADASIFDSAGNQITSGNMAAENSIEVQESLVMRDLIMHRVAIEVEREEKGQLSVLNSAVIRLQAQSAIENIQSVSSVFAPVYSRMVDNYETSYLRNLQEMPAKMLIVTHEDLDNLNYFTDWKNECGIATEIVYKSDLGTTAGDIKSYVQQTYESEEHPPDYLLLVGDVNGGYAIPSYYISAENDVTDHPYTLLEGEDYLPEMIVGRFSIDQQEDLNTIIAKVLNYEKTPYMDDPDWYERMLVVAGNYSDTPPPPTTPVTTSMWLADKARDYGYQEVTEIYYWPDAGYVTYPGTVEIANAINSGAGVVTYRGWGNAWGWNYPYFHTENLLQLTNNVYLPVMTSMVCNTGDFANSNVDPCFGELWLTGGNTTNPKGGVVFVGPSDLHTKTNYNNSIFSGFHQGMLEESIYNFGVAVLRGKTELYDNFPLNHGAEDDVEFYFHVYNILGDPSLKMWTRTPQQITCDLPSEIALGQNYLDINVPEIANGMVTARKDGEFLVSEFIRDHNATLYFDAETEGDVHLTITAVNRLPLFTDIEVVTTAIDPVITAIEPAGDIMAGETINIDLTLTNQGTESAQFSGTIAEMTGMAELASASFDFGTLAAGENAVITIEAAIAPECLNNWELSFELDFTALDMVVKFPLLVSNMILNPLSVAVNDTNGVLEPGETADITVTVANNGTFAATGLTAVITSATDAMVVNDNTADIGEIAIGATGEATFNVTAEAAGFNGRDAGIYIEFQDADGRVMESMFTITIGVVTNADPTGPCPGGYYAYDSFDTAYEEAPVYFWQEIDPDLGGSGDVILMEDDESDTIGLPFDFTYYDAEYDSITISSNGWISFITTWQDYFRNWRIPSALGPYAQIAAYWDDLIGPGGGVQPSRICYYYDSAENYFIIEWANAVNREDDTSPEQFQIVLYDPAVYTTASGNGIIQVNYSQVNNPDTNGNYCTVGIENEEQEYGVLYTYADIYPASATQLQNEMAIKFTTEAPDSFVDADNTGIVPFAPVLYANYPNPFNPVTTFSFSLPEAQDVELAVYNVKGEKVKSIVSSNLQAGEHNYLWHGDDSFGNSVASGIYFYKLSTSKHTTTKKCVLMK